MSDPFGGSSFLPTIKCSMCAQDIEISQMGDHVCGGPGPSPSSGEPTPPPDSKATFDRMGQDRSSANGPGFLKPGRSIPPRVDTTAANRPFLPRDELTPVSATTSSNVSPMTPNPPAQPSYNHPPRSATAPLFETPPSPEAVSPNLDSPFPLFPTKKLTAPQRSQTGLDPNGGPDRLGYKFAEADPMYAPVSPRTATTGGLLKRMNTIAPGPFDINRRKRTDEPSVPGHRRQETGASLGGGRKPSFAGETIQRPSTAAGPGHSRTSTNSSSSSAGSRSNIMFPKVPRTNGYGGFGPPPGETGSLETLGPENRAQTFPLQSESQAPQFRRPSQVADSRLRTPPRTETPENRPQDGRFLSGSPHRQRNPSVSGPDRSRPPPRGTSLIRPRAGTRLGDNPSLAASLNLDAEFGSGNPYHTPTESSSSNNSAFSAASKASSISSAPSIDGANRRSPSETPKTENMMAHIENAMSELEPRHSPSNSAPPPRPKEQFARSLQPPANINPSMLSPESPMDPAIQSGRLTPNSRPRSPDRRNDPRSRPQYRSQSPRPAQPQLRAHSPLRPPEPMQPPKRRPTAKGNCKGCEEPITGKSISSADGRLTGRYHKQCFVCKTCSEPFKTATFYVIDDAPYCERHYHKLNGSMCHTCDRGIEGQYLESERKQKYHPGCLTCADCKRSLRHDYFEMRGNVYCERDAFRRAQQGRYLGAGGPSTRMERRTTRLMMM